MHPRFALVDCRIGCPPSYNINAISTLQAAEEASSSGSAGHRRTKLVFVNHTSSPVQLFWYAADCEETHYRTIAPGARERVGSYTCHRWKVRDEAGAYLVCTVGRGRCAAACTLAAAVAWSCAVCLLCCVELPAVASGAQQRKLKRSRRPLCTPKTCTQRSNAQA